MIKPNPTLMALGALCFGAVSVSADLVTYLNLDTSTGLTAEFQNSPGGTAAITTGGSGYFGEAAEFDGRGYYRVDAGGGIVGTEARTYAAWVQLSSAASGDNIAFGSGMNGDGTKFDVAVDAIDNVEGAIGQGRSSTSLALGLDTWQFVAITVRAGGTAGDIISYVNDVRIVAEPNSRKINTDGASLRIGIASNYNTDYSEGGWIGLVDDISIWNEQLTADELRGLYDLGQQLSYTADQFNSMKRIHDAGYGRVVVNGFEWQYSSGLRGDAGLNGENTLILNAAAGTGLVSDRVSIPEPASISLLVGLLSFVSVWLRRLR